MDNPGELLMEDSRGPFATTRVVPLQDWGGCSPATSVRERRTYLGIVKVVDTPVAMVAQNDVGLGRKRFDEGASSMMKPCS